jgi:Spy/CpxP family protein refolding chaperone
MPEKRKTKLRAGLLLAGVFALGGVSGAAIMRWQLYEELRDTMRLPPAEARAQFRLRAMRRHLDLSDEQAAKIEKILVDAARERDELEAPCQPPIDEQRTRVRKQIDEVLTPEQLKLHEEARERWRQKKEKRGR